MLAPKSGPYLAAAVSVEAVPVALWVFTRNDLWPWVALALVLPVMFVFWFFRDPERVAGPGVVSPADGRVLRAENGPDGLLVSIFMSPLDVHVNRSPETGQIQTVEHQPGSHVPAFRKESERNERVDIVLTTASGDFRIRLIAGTVARRIHPYLRAGSKVKKGDRIGLIAFGSRCDLSLPAGTHRLRVQAGDRVKAGETTVAQPEAQPT